MGYRLITNILVLSKVLIILAYNDVNFTKIYNFDTINTSYDFLY